MKSLLVTLALFSPALGLAHGSIPHQASNAVKVATDLFIAANTKPVLRTVTSVSAVLTGHEKFEVLITVNSSTVPFKYECKENEEVTPVVWECTAL